MSGDNSFDVVVKRVNWIDTILEGDVYKTLRIMAEEINGSWRFFEKGLWDDDSNRKPISSTNELVKKANAEFAKKQNKTLLNVK